ncbi:hypothetical protein [Rhizobium sp. GR12]|uniref:hypothetical protein n=1 Tax=Rhizobium sp. GR12 TaxID=3053925 RepID=UPI002FBEDBD2
MTDPAEKSPAVESIERERAEQTEHAVADELEEGLEDSFPASDPISATSAGDRRSPGK